MLEDGEATTAEPSRRPDGLWGVRSSHDLLGGLIHDYDLVAA